MWDSLLDFLSLLSPSGGSDEKSTAFWWTFVIGALMVVGGILAWLAEMMAVGIGLCIVGGVVVVMACVLERMAWGS